MVAFKIIFVIQVWHEVKFHVISYEFYETVAPSNQSITENCKEKK